MVPARPGSSTGKWRAGSPCSTFLASSRRYPFRASGQRGGHPAVDGDDGSGHVARSVGAEEGRELGDLLGLAAALERGALDEIGEPLRRSGSSGHLRLDEPGADRDGTDALRPVFDRSRLRERDDAGLGRRVHADRELRRVDAARRRPVDDDAPTRREHRVDAVLGAEPDAAEVDVHDPVVLLHAALASDPAVPIPATLRTASTRPKASRAAANIASIWSSFVTSQRQGTTASPSEPAVSSSRPLMSAARTRAPSRTKTVVVALAIPDPAPVMHATLPSSSAIRSSRSRVGLTKLADRLP